VIGVANLPNEDLVPENRHLMVRVVWTLTEQVWRATLGGKFARLLNRWDLDLVTGAKRVDPRRGRMRAR
jgi:hypothetical protein